MLQRPILIFLLGVFTGGSVVASAVALGLILAWSRAEEKQPTNAHPDTKAIHRKLDRTDQGPEFNKPTQTAKG